MAVNDPRTMAMLLVDTKHALGLTDEALGNMLGWSRRTTLRRWHAPNTIETAKFSILAKAVFPLNQDLAARLASAAGSDLESLGLVTKPTPSHSASPTPPPDARLVDAVLCAASEALNASPAVVRPALLIAMRRIRELGLDLATMEAGLTPASKRQK
jgi:hypothetical protein